MSTASLASLYPVSQQLDLDPRYVSPAAVLALQRTIGNAAVNRLLRQRESMQYAGADHDGPSSLSLSSPLSNAYTPSARRGERMTETESAASASHAGTASTGDSREASQRATGSSAARSTIATAIRRKPDQSISTPIQRITRGAGWGTAWKLGMGLLPADATLWERIRKAVEETLPARVLTLTNLETAASRATPADVTATIETLRKDQAKANGLTLNYADAARLDKDTKEWIGTADNLIRRLEDAKARRKLADDVETKLKAAVKAVDAAPDEVRTRKNVIDARTRAVDLRNQVVPVFDPVEKTIGQFESAMRNLDHTLNQALSNHIKKQFDEEGARIGQVVDQLIDAMREPEVPGSGETGRSALAGLKQRLSAQRSVDLPATVAALDAWIQASKKLRDQAAQDLAAVETAALREGRAVIAARTTNRLTHYTANVVPWLTLLPDTDGQRLRGIEAEYRKHASEAPTATLASLVSRHGQLGPLDTRYDQTRSDARLTDLAALNPAYLVAARAATSDALVARALSGMNTAQLQASGNVVLQYFATHGAALTPLLPRYHPSFAYRASPASLNVVTPNEFTVLGWLHRESGTMPGTVQLNSPSITRHGGGIFAVNFGHFIEVHFARYADAATLKNRTNPTTFYPDTVTTATFITQQIQPALNAWPDMPALVQAINAATEYNQRRQLSHGGFTFELRVGVTAGTGSASLTQCFPIAPHGGAILLSAARTNAMGQLLDLLL